MEKVRTSFLKKLEQRSSDPKKWKVMLKEYFLKYDVDGNGMSKQEFEKFLKDGMNLYDISNKKKYELFWSAVDFDLSDNISWDEVSSTFKYMHAFAQQHSHKHTYQTHTLSLTHTQLYVIVFPELKMAMRKELAIIRHLRQSFKAKMVSQGVPVNSYKSSLKTLFTQYDVDNSSTIYPKEFDNLVLELGISEEYQKPRKIKQIFATLDFDEGGYLEFEEFAGMMLEEEDGEHGAFIPQMSSNEIL